MRRAALSQPASTPRGRSTTCARPSRRNGAVIAGPASAQSSRSSITAQASANPASAPWAAAAALVPRPSRETGSALQPPHVAAQPEWTRSPQIRPAAVPVSRRIASRSATIRYRIDRRLPERPSRKVPSPAQPATRLPRRHHVAAASGIHVRLHCRGTFSDLCATEPAAAIASGAQAANIDCHRPSGANASSGTRQKIASVPTSYRPDTAEAQTPCATPNPSQRHKSPAGKARQTEPHRTRPVRTAAIARRVNGWDRPGYNSARPCASRIRRGSFVSRTVPLARSNPGNPSRSVAHAGGTQ